MRTILFATATLAAAALPQLSACTNNDCTVTKTCPVGSSGQGGDDTSSQGGATTMSQGGATTSQGGAGGAIPDTCGNNLVDAGELCFTEAPLFFDIGGSEPYDILLHDCSGDDRLDIIVAQDGSSNLIVMENSGSGTFPLSATRSVVDPPVTLAIGETSSSIQGPELIVGYSGGGYTDTNRIGNGCQITYEYPLYHPGMAGRPEVEVGDVVSSSSVDEIIILHSDRIFYRGSNSTALERTLQGGPKAGLTLAPISDDNDADLIMVDVSANALEVYRTSVSNGTPSFPGIPTQALSTGANPTDTAAGDIDGDGDDDIVVSNGAGNSVSVYLNNSASGVSLSKKPVDIPVGGQPVLIRLADLDDDDDLDIIVANYESIAGKSTVSLLLNDGSGSFVSAPSSPLEIAALPLALEVADVNIDGAPDIIVASAIGNGSTAQLSVIRSRP